ncbi:hypothetical protein MMC13_004113 [Lambiella insularis]|nr:hypothetical protein [Lambiella insularis]
MASSSRSAPVPDPPSAQTIINRRHAARLLTLYTNARARAPLANLARTPDRRYVWTRDQIRDAIILKRFGEELGTGTITDLINARYSTRKTKKTVGHMLQVHSGTLPPSEVRRRTGRQQPDQSAVWEWYGSPGTTAVVRRVLTEYGQPVPEVEEEEEEDGEEGDVEGLEGGEDFILEVEEEVDEEDGDEEEEDGGEDHEAGDVASLSGDGGVITHTENPTS